MGGTITVGVILFIAGFICAILILKFASGPSSDQQVGIYNDALRKARAVPAPAAGSAEEKEALEKWKGLLADLASDYISEGVKDVYAPELFFNDTLKNIHSAEELTDHFAATAELLYSGSVKYLSETRDENGDYFVRWEMTYSGKRLNDGKPIVTIGMSQLRFNESGQVVFHQDFWDSTAGVFEHIPLLGGPVKYIRSRM